MLERAGFKALFVGGCVRNSVMGLPVTDYDLTTDAHPRQVTDLMTGAGRKVIPTGFDHGTVTVVANGIPFEITTLRRDTETDGRHALVAFTDKIEEDAARRDFTMNALYCDARGTVTDPLGGLPDAVSGRLRFVGVALDRVREDYLRILRFFRFHAWYADPALGFDAEGLDACARGADCLAGISAERIGAEIRKLLAAPDPAPELAAMQTCGVLRVILPGADATSLPALIHLEGETGTAPDPMTRLAVLGGEGVAERIRLSRRDAKRLESIGAAARDAIPPHELGYRLGDADGRAAMIVHHALIGTPVSPTGLAEVTRGAAAQFPVAAADLMPALSGPALGAGLAELEAAWLASGLRLTREELLARRNQSIRPF